MTMGEWKVKAATEMKTYLKEKINYPNCDPKLVLQHLLPMWQMLEKKGLVLKGQTYEAFARQGHHKYMEMEMRRILGLQ